MENSGVVFMLDEEKSEDLARMYSLFGRTSDGQSKLREHMSEHLRETGKNIVTMQSKSAAKPTGATDAGDDKRQCR